MAITISGNAGVGFNITVTDTAASTGTKTVNYAVESSVGDLTYTNASGVFAWAGKVGTAGTTLNLNAIADANDGTYYLRLDNNTSGTALTSCSTIVVHNKHAAAVITLQPGATNSFLTASEQVTIPAGAAIQYSWGTAKTVSASLCNLKLISNVLNTDVEVYVLGA